MREMELDNRFFSYAFYFSAMSMFLFSILFHNIFLLVVAMVLILVSALYLHSGEIVNNFLLRRGKIVFLGGNYKIGENARSAVRRAEREYSSVSCALLKKTGEGRSGEAIEALISSIGFPFEFSLGLKRADKEKLLDGVEEKRRMKEIEISRTDQKDYDRLNGLRRELGIIEGEIKNLTGQMPLAMTMRLKVFGLGQSESEATRESAQNLEQLSNSFASSLGFGCEILEGRRLAEELGLGGRRWD